MDETNYIQWDFLQYTVAELNYGGRVTDFADRDRLKIILDRFYCPHILEFEYKFSESGTYFCPEATSKKEYMEYIAQLPLNDDTELYGMHDNAEISARLI